MATKNTGVPCFDKAAPDEPVFVLRAQDAAAAGTVRYWVSLAKRAGTPQAKLDEALKTADEMEKWPTKKVAD